MSDQTLHIPSAANGLQQVLKLVAKGLERSERQLLEGLVKVSQRDTRRRTQKLTMLDDADAQNADVLLIDVRDAAAMSWARQQPWLGRKAVIWIDANSVPAGHTLARRPVQWPVLPILLMRALEQGPGSEGAVPPQVPAEWAGTKPDTQVAAAGEPSGPRPQRILVVDDSALVRLQLRTVLEQRGIEVVDAESVPAALETMSAGAFDCVLMDVLMPGADGYEGCRQLKARQRGRATPVLMLTSKSSPFDRIRGKMAGCDAYLTKPVNPRELFEALSRHLHGPASVASTVLGMPARLPLAAMNS